jgi:hypothetical protein
MAAMAELSLTLDLMGKCFKTLLYWNHLDNWNQTFQECSFDGPKGPSNDWFPAGSPINLWLEMVASLDFQST